MRMRLLSAAGVLCALGLFADVAGGQTVAVPQLGLKLESSGPGLKVTSVTDNSPASKAGINVDDVIYTVNGVSAVKTDFALVTADGFGSLKLRLLRVDTNTLVVLEVQESQSGEVWVYAPSLGMAMESEAQGPLRIAGVTPGGQAAFRQLAKADTIEAVNGLRVKDFGGLFDIADKSGLNTISLQVRQFANGEVRDVSMDLGGGFGVVGTALASTGNFGLELESLSDRLRVFAVTPNSTAERLGLKKDDFVLLLDGQHVDDFSGSFDQLQSLTIYRPNPPQVKQILSNGQDFLVQIPAVLRVVNILPYDVDLFWEPGENQPLQHYETLVPGAVYTMQTALSHTFVIRNRQSGEILKRATVSHVQQLMVARED